MVKFLFRLLPAPNKLWATVVACVLFIPLQGCTSLSIRVNDKPVFDVSINRPEEPKEEPKNEVPSTDSPTPAVKEPDIEEPVKIGQTPAPVDVLETQEVSKQEDKKTPLPSLPQDLAPQDLTPPDHTEEPEELESPEVASLPPSPSPRTGRELQNCSGRSDELYDAYGEASSAAHFSDPLRPYLQMSVMASQLWQDCQYALDHPELARGVSGIIYFLGGHFEQAVEALDDSIGRYRSNSQNAPPREFVKLNTIIKSCMHRPNLLNMHRMADALYSQRQYPEAEAKYQAIKHQSNNCNAVRMHATNQLFLIDEQRPY